MWDLLYLSFYLSCELLEKFGYYSCDHFEKSCRVDYDEKWFQNHISFIDMNIFGMLPF